MDYYIVLPEDMNVGVVLITNGLYAVNNVDRAIQEADYRSKILHKTEIVYKVSVEHKRNYYEYDE